MDQNVTGKTRPAAPGIRSTISFIIFLESTLGQGATSRVYLGRNKKSGKRVACKVPHGQGILRPGVDLDGESKVLLQLRHPNIVCLEAIEKDQISQDNILFMELCSGGSLYDRLERPENSQGFEERVFLDILKDITCGMKYLRENGFIHRDVKPGNIMCYTESSGRTIYKLADFGAARELTEDENFTSLHGTEEYLHPNIFERAVLRRSDGAAFDAKVDLWSLGATLYHIATGLLPFRPQGGRRNSKMMFHLTTKKASGVISGVQTGPGEHEIIWSTELPETCQLSMGLQRLVTPMLAGLMEYDATKMWSFRKFFEVSQSITNKTALRVFWMCESSIITVYTSPTDTFADFQEHVASQTKMPAGKQSFLLNREPFQPNRTDTIREFPLVSESNPIILCRRQEIHVTSQIYPPLITFMPTLPPRFSTQNDYPIAKSAVTVCHILRRRQTLLHQMHEYFDDCAYTLEAGLRSDSLRLQTPRSDMRGMLSLASTELERGQLLLSLRPRLEAAERQQTAQPTRSDVDSYIQRLQDQCVILLERLHRCKRQLSEVDYILEKLSLNLYGKDSRRPSWKPSQGCNLTGNACATELVHLTDQMEEILKRFTRDKKVGKLSYNDEQIHKMEKMNLSDLMKRTTKCIKGCEDRWKTRHSKLMVWYNHSQERRSLITKANAVLVPLVKDCVDLRDDVSELTSRCWQIFESHMPISPRRSLHPAMADSTTVLLSAGTQTAAPAEGMDPRVTYGLEHLSQRLYHTNSRGEPVRELGGPWSSPIDSKGREADDCLPERSQVSAPCVTETDRSPLASPRHRLFTDTSGSRMIRIPKQLKQDIDEYKKNASSIPQLLKETSEVMNMGEGADLSLGEVETPIGVHDDTIFLPTLVPVGAEGTEEDLGSLSAIESLEIKHPPLSYRSSSE